MMDSWSTTFRLLVVMAAIAVSYIVGRVFTETLQQIAAGGSSFWIGHPGQSKNQSGASTYVPLWFSLLDQASDRARSRLDFSGLPPLRQLRICCCLDNALAGRNSP